MIAAQPSRHPSMVALQMHDDRYYKGSAFLIAPDVVVTAAHNVAYVDDIEAVFSPTPCWGPNVCGERRVRIARKIVHPRFRQIEGGTEFDLAVLKLASTVDAPTVSLAKVPATLSILKAFGFGTDRESEGAPLSAFRLRAMILPSLTPGYTLGSSQKFWVNQEKGGICAGDSGGPALLAHGAVAGLAIHVTYSGGKAHCLTKAAFTDVVYFKDWLAEAIYLSHLPDL